MFVSVVLDPGGIDSARALVSVLVHSGFKKIQRACWESMSVTENDLSMLKKEIDRVTDYYDAVRIYQFPVNGMFVITELKQKRWKRCQMKNSSKSDAAGNASGTGKKTSARTGKTVPASKKSAVSSRRPLTAGKTPVRKSTPKK